jgi:DNA polymerase-3 subunit chi
MSQSTDKALPILLGKALASGKNIKVKTTTADNLSHLDELLWTVPAQSFLPHGTAADGHSAQQPIFLSLDDEIPNDAKILFVAHGATIHDAARFDLVCIVMENNDPDIIASYRALWSQFKKDNHSVTYWQQSDDGSWHKKSL